MAANLCNFEIEPREAPPIVKSSLIATTDLCTIEHKPRERMQCSTSNNIYNIEIKAEKKQVVDQATQIESTPKAEIGAQADIAEPRAARADAAA